MLATTHSSRIDRSKKPNVITSPPKPTYTDTSVNVATAFYQAAAAQMAPTTWNNNLRPTSRTGRGSTSEHEKENRQLVNGQKPLSRTSNNGSIALVSDSEPEEDFDAKGRPLSKTSLTGVRSQLTRALSPAAYYVRERSRDPEESNQSLNVPRSFSRESSYDYATEQAHYEELLAKARDRRASQEPPENSVETSFEGANTSKAPVKKHRSRISVDNQAWKPGKDDEDDDEYNSDAGKKRRKKRKKDEVARLGGLPTLNYGKKRKGRKSGANPETIEEVDESSYGNETSEMITEDSGVSFTSFTITSFLKFLQFQLPPTPQQDSSLTEEKSIPLNDPPSATIPPPMADEEIRAPHQRKRSRSRSRSAPPETVRPRRPPFSPGAALGSVIRFTTISLIRTVAFFWQTLVFLVKTPLGIVLLLGLMASTIYYLDLPIPSIPTIPVPSNPFSWPSRPVYNAPSIPAGTIDELVSRLTKAENALQELSSKYAHSQGSLEAELRITRQQNSRIALLESRLEGEIKRSMDMTDATRQSNGQSIQALRADIAALRNQMATTPSGNPELELRLEKTVQALEGRMDLAESSVKDALEYVKTSMQTSPKNLKSGTVIKTSDGKDVSTIIGELVDEALSVFAQDGIGKADFALYSAGGRVLPSLTTPSYEIKPSSWFTYVLGWPFGRGFATGLPPVTALTSDLNLGRCWAFSGTHGQLAIVLARQVHISEFSIDHARPSFDVRSAPKQITFWGFVEGADNLEKYEAYRERIDAQRAEATLDGEILDPEPILHGAPRGIPYLHLSTVTYDIHSPSHIQTFSIPQEIQDLGIDIGVVVFEINDNWGDDNYTCLYRVRVHGVEKDAPPPPPLLPDPEEI